MKTFVAFLAFVAAVTAVPFVVEYNAEGEQPDTRFIGGIIEGVIEELVKQIPDPIHIEQETVVVELASPNLALAASVSNLDLVGQSNLAINRMSYNVLTSRLTYDVSLPRVSLSIGQAAAEIIAGDVVLGGSGHGTVEIVQARAAGTARVSVGIFSGVNIRDLSVVLSLEGLDSNLSVNVQGIDLSNLINNGLESIPSLLSTHQARISDVVETVLLSIIDRVL